MRTLFLLLAAGAVAFSQSAPPDGVSVTVSRTLPLAPAFLTYQLMVNANTLDDALAVVAPLGLGPADFYTGSSFHWRVPYSSRDEAVRKLSSLKLAGYWVIAIDPDPKSVNDSKVIGDLTLDARNRAQVIATAAGKTLGRIVSIADVGVLRPNLIGIPTAAMRVGDFSTGLPAFIATPFYPTLQTTYTLLVRFAWQ